jgi:hypothetical protein
MALRRRPSFRNPKQTFYILCEGANTEPEYFNAVKRLNTQIILDVRRGVGVPMTVASAASDLCKERGLSKKSKKKLNSFETRDQVWAVFDRDEHPKFDDAIALCNKTGVGVGRSNPCFEVWLILHREDYHKPDGRKLVQDRLAKICPEYDAKKGKTADCSKLIEALELAEKRSVAQLKKRSDEGSPFGPPSTTVHLLTQAIRAAISTSSASPET